VPVRINTALPHSLVGDRLAETEAEGVERAHGVREATTGEGETS
jgi:hypothetical protein